MLVVTAIFACRPDAGKDSIAVDSSPVDSDSRSSDTDSGTPDSESPADSDSAESAKDSHDSTPDDTNPDTGPIDADGDGSPAADDCDDSRADVYPGAVEVCRDGVDTNCDGLPGDCAPRGVFSAGTADTVVDACGAWPEAIVNLGDTQGDGVDEIMFGPGGLSLVTAAFPSSVRGAVAVTDVETATGMISGSGGNFGQGAIEALGDTNGDGYTDFAMVEPTSPVSVYRGPLRVGMGYSNADAQVNIQSPTSGGLGEELALVDDLDGDGISELAIGDGYDWATATDGGGAFVFPVNLVGGWGAYEASTTIRGTAEEHFASGLAAADLDGDGLEELVGAASGSGLLYAFRSAAPGTTADVADTSVFVDVGSGTSVCNLGDWTGDGLDDVAVGGTSTSDGFGRVWVVAGASMLAAPLAVVTGDAAGDGLGDPVAGPGDVDGDGLGDLLVAAPDTATGGNVWLLAGGQTGTLALGDAIVRIDADAINDRLGGPGALAALGDIDGDGLGDFAVGEQNTGYDHASYVYVWTSTGW